MASKAELVDQIKSLQRTDIELKQAWGAYCDQQLGGVRDPNRHDAGVLQTFLGSYGAGEIGGASYNGGGVSHGGHRGSSYAAGGYGAEAVANPWHKVTHSVNQEDEGQAALVQEVKDFQRSDPECKQAWAEYCDASLGGTRDPSRHDAVTLQAFLSSYSGGGLSSYSAGAKATSDSVGGWAAAGPPQAPWAGGAADTYSHSRNGSSTGASTSTYNPPTRSGGKGYSAPSSYSAAYAGGGAVGGGTSDLVGLVKAGQRISVSWKGAWQGYCEAYGNGTMDPAKHEQSFIAGFFEYLGQLGLADLGAAAPAPAVGSKRSAPSSWSAPPAKRMMGAPPGGGGAMDAEKTALIERVKALQRQDQDIKQAWATFVDEQHGGTRDPARHDKETLETFLAKFEIDV